MISGFENITSPLTKEELTLMEIIASNFARNYIGKTKAITGHVIVTRMKEKGYNITEPRLRKIMNHIRKTGIAPILSNSKGYWYSNSSLEIQEQVKSLKERSQAIMAAADGLINYTNKNFNQCKIGF
jgi:hypothetical protein